MERATSGPGYVVILLLTALAVGLIAAFLEAGDPGREIPRCARPAHRKHEGHAERADGAHHLGRGYLAIILTTAAVVGLAVALLELWWR